MFFKTATVACSLAALLMVGGCDTADDDVDVVDDTVVAPADDYTPDTGLEGTEPVTPDPATDVTPAPETDIDVTDPEPTDLDDTETEEPVVEEVEADSLPEVESEDE